jgi:hypothetical protein
MAWFYCLPIGEIVLVFFIAARFGGKLQLTPEEFADRLERHLLGTEDVDEWDEITSCPVEDERLAHLQSTLWKFDSLGRQEDKDELALVIAALRQGEIPFVRASTRGRLLDLGD